MTSCKKPLLSVVIPAYNAGRFIRECVESVCRQGFPEGQCEIIVVNDGSTDGTLDELQALSEIHSCLNTVTTPNGGLSRARNEGMRHANGKYLFFLDADDTLVPDTLLYICERMETDNLDMLLVNYRYVKPDGTTLPAHFHIERNSTHVQSGRDFMLRNSYPPMAWAYVYRRGFLNECQLAFMPIGHEDEEFTPRALFLSRRIAYYPGVVYNYRLHEYSFMNKYKEQNFKDMITAMKSVNRFKEIHCADDSRICRHLEDRIARILLMIFKRSIREGYPIQEELIAWMKAEGLFPLKPAKRSFYSLLFNASPRWFEKYYRWIKKR